MILSHIIEPVGLHKVSFNTDVCSAGGLEVNSVYHIRLIIHVKKTYYLKNFGQILTSFKTQTHKTPQKKQVASITLQKK